MILNSFTLPAITIFARNDRTGGRRVFLPTNKTFEGIWIALAGKFLQNFFKRTIKYSLKLIYEHVS